MVHGALYINRQWHPTKQPKAVRDRFVQRGEVISVWEAEHNDHWYQWHIDNPNVIRFRVDTTLEAALPLQAEYALSRADDPTQIETIAKRLWRFDIDEMLTAAIQSLGRNLDPATDILEIDPASLTRKARGGRLHNKSVGDVPLENPDRVSNPRKL